MEEKERRDVEEKKANNAANGKLSWPVRLSYAGGDVACNVVFGMVGTLLTLFYTDYVGVAAATVGLIMLLSRFFDGFSDMIMGIIVEKTNSKWGKSRPWILWMSVPYALSAILLFTVPHTMGVVQSIYIFVTYNFCTTVCYTAINLPYGSLSAMMTRVSSERDMLSVVRMGLSPLGKIIGTCYDTYELFKDCDMSFGNVIDSDGKEIELTNSNYSLFIESKDRKVRESAFNTLYSEYKKYTNTYASLIATNMKELSTLAKIYKYDTAIEMSLFGDDVSIDVYNNLIDSVHEKIGYIYEYYNLKKGILGLDELHLYDIYVPIVGEYDKKYEYEEAKNIIIKVLEVFGDEYVNKVKEGLDSRWIDVYPTKNKRTGGYSGGMYDTYPYILLNYQDKYNDMSTLIHEMGHSMHSYYSRNYNTYQNSEYRIFVAEVASTVNELLLSHYMLEHSNSKEERLFILNNLMELYRATIYRQTMFAEFEKEISNVIDNDGALTADKLSNMYYNLNKFYFGDNVVVDDYIRYEWERIPHFFYDFYVYKYATGLSAATVIVNNILSGKEEAVDGYIEFLKCGSRKSPIESLKLAGVDLTKKEVVTSALDEFKNILDMYKKETN